MYEYNPELIAAAICGRERVRNACREIASYYSTHPLCESVYYRICTRRKLYNFLESLDYSESEIKAIFWSHNLAVPRDTKLIRAAIPKKETKPAWLNYVNDDRDIL